MTDADKLIIANMALDRLGEPEIDDITADEQLPKKLNRNIDHRVKFVQSGFLWPELMEPATVLVLDETYDPSDEAEFAYRFTLPDDFLEIDEVLPSTVDYVLEGGYLYADAEEAELTYTKLNETVSSWSARLLECVVMDFAANVAIAVSKNEKIAEQIKALLDQVEFPRARYRESRNQRRATRRTINGRWNSARSGGVILSLMFCLLAGFARGEPGYQVRHSFNGGILSKQLQWRSDLAPYYKGCRQLENFYVTPYGGVSRRPGTEVVASYTNLTACRVMPFRYSSDVQYLIALLADTNGSRFVVMDTDGTELDTVDCDYSTNDFFNIQTVQSADVLFLANNNYAVQRLERTSETNWVLTNQTFTGGPFLDENRDETLTIGASATTGTVTLTASAAVFEAGHSNALWNLVQRKPEIFDRTRTRWAFDTYAEQQINENPSAGQDLGNNDFTSGKYIYYRPVSGDDYPCYVALQAWDHLTDFTGSYDPADYPTFWSRGWDMLGPYTVGDLWNFTTHDGTTWKATWAIERSFDDGATWELYQTYSNPDAERDFNITSSFEDGEYLIKLRLYSSYASYSDWVDLKIYSYENNGNLQITAVNSSTSATATVLNDLVSIAPVYTWQEGAFCDQNGYPGTISIYEERMLLGGTIGSPYTIFGSKIDDWEEWGLDTLADSPLQFDLISDQVETISWMTARNDLMIGTDSAEWVLKNGDSATALSGENPPKVNRYTQFGSKKQPALLTSDLIFYTQLYGKKVRSMQYDYNLDSYLSADLTILAPEVLEAGVKQTVYISSPFPMVWVVRDDGKAAAFTYDRENEVSAWSEHWTTNGLIQSMCSLKGDENDVLYSVIQRGNVWNIEKMDFADEDIRDARQGTNSVPVYSLFQPTTLTYTAEELAGGTYSVSDVDLYLVDSLGGQVSYDGANWQNIGYSGTNAVSGRVRTRYSSRHSDQIDVFVKNSSANPMTISAMGINMQRTD